MMGGAEAKGKKREVSAIVGALQRDTNFSKVFIVKEDF